MLEKTDGAIKNRQSKATGNICTQDTGRRQTKHNFATQHTKSVTNHERGNRAILTTPNGTYPWLFVTQIFLKG